MPTAKIAITLDKEIVEQLDQWVREGRYPSRSNAIQESVKERIARWRKTRLIEEAVKLDPKEERALAEESLAAENEVWPEY
jgi:Arc/MetJ-type ribon-helix-helix transcriptional regulator